MTNIADEKKTNFYSLLDLNSEAELNKIEDRFIYKILRVYPKQGNISKDTEKKIKNLIYAFEILKDKNKRNIYDKYLNNNIKYKIDIKKILVDINTIADYLISISYVNFIRYLQHNYKIITSIRANALIGLLYEEIESSLDKVENIDPEDILPKMPLHKEVFYEFLIVVSVFIIYVVLIIIIIFIG